MSEKWITRWKQDIAPRAVKPGVWRRREGGFLVRGRTTDPKTGRRREVQKIVLETDASVALVRLQESLQTIRSGTEPEARERQRFADYIVSLLERRILQGKIKSAKSREKWRYVLERHLIPAFGDLYVDRIRFAEIDRWWSDVGRMISVGKYKPSTANDWISILRVVMQAAKREFSLPFLATEGIEDFDTSEHPTYTEEQPNSLTVDETRAFVGKMHEMFPQHFGMVALGFGLGLRPSSLRPLRRSGPTPDVVLDPGVLLVRRSQTMGDEVMNTTKTKQHQRIELPPELVSILRWHLDQLPAGKMRDSELLFPSEKGSFRARSVLDVPFQKTAEAIGLKKHITPRAMRRTFQDLARAAKVNDVVTRAISGHATETMQHHYSTVDSLEVKSGIARVIDLAGFREALGGKMGGTTPDAKTAGSL